MRTVIDVGCARYGGKYDSLERLIEMFEPNHLFGFDPDLMGARDACFWLPPAGPTEALGITYEHQYGDTAITVQAVAAWTYDGQIGFKPGQLGGWTGAGFELPKVPCIDLGFFIEGLQADEIILKLDCEGAEYALIPDLIKRGIDGKLAKVLVEWHPAEDYYGRLVESLDCEYEEWLW